VSVWLYQRAALHLKPVKEAASDLMIPLPRGTSNSAHEHQDQQNYDHETQPAPAVIAGAVERRAADAAYTAEENKN
jgi:hypothetical protein